jgi:hypothetical protein
VQPVDLCPVASDLTEILQRVDARLRALRSETRRIESARPERSAVHAARDAPPGDAESTDPIMMMLRQVEAKGINLPGGIEYVKGYRRAQMADQQTAPATTAATVAGARDELAEDRVRLERAADEGAIDAVNGLARLHVGLQEYAAAQRCLAGGAERFGYTAAARLVSVAPDLLGAGLELDGDAVGDTDGGADAEFTIISPYPERAAAAIDRVAHRLSDVDEHGVELSIDARFAQGRDRSEAYTPNYVSDVMIAPEGAKLRIDTKGVMWSAMGHTIVVILTGALSDDRVAAHIVGTCSDLNAAFEIWPGLRGSGA